MKKRLSLLLALALLVTLFSAVGCATEKKEETTAPPAGQTAPTEEKEAAPPAEPALSDEERLKNSLPNEYVPEKIENGMEVIVAYEFLTLADQFYTALSDGIQKDLEALGYTYISSSFDGVVSVQLEHIENFLTMGAACIITALNDPESGIALSAMCEEQGCYFIQQGSVPSGPVSAAVNVDQVQIGTECGKMASAWIDQTYPDAGAGDLHVAFLGNTTNSDPAVRTAATEEFINADPRLDYVFNNHAAISLDAAFTSIQDAFTYDPEIKLVFTFNVTQAIGANNYIASIEGVDLSQYGVFCCGSNADVLKLIDQAATNDGSVIRGTIAFGGASPWAGVMGAALGLFDGSYEPGVVIWEPDWSINCFGYEYSSI